jgi:uncharacterized membrane protein
VIGDGEDDNKVFKDFIYKDGQYTELLPEGWASAEVTDINNKGMVVGACYESDTYESTGFVYTDGKYTVLLPKSCSQTDATGINDNGVIVGNCGVVASSKWFMATTIHQN